MKLKYQKVIDYLLSIFSTERYVEGQKLPTETRLMEELNVGRNTVRKAIFEMEKSGIVKSRQGSGTFYVSHEDKNDKSSGGLIGLANLSGMEYIYPEIIRGVEDTLRDQGYSLVISSSNIDSLKNLSSLKLMLDQNVKGLILDLSRVLSVDVESSILNLVHSAELPVVTTHWNGSLKRFSTISIDDVLGGYEATKYLITKGHRKIAMVYNSTQAGSYRLKGYKKALEEAGIKFDENYIKLYDDRAIMHEDFGYTCTNEILDRTGVEPTAFFYFNDQTAIEGYQALAERGLRIPDDISVIGFDDYKHSQFLNPPLTTLVHPKYDFGKWAAKMILHLIDDKGSYHPRNIIFEPELLERGSVKSIL